jgi:hypothetical protein
LSTDNTAKRQCTARGYVSYLIPKINWLPIPLALENRTVGRTNTFGSSFANFWQGQKYFKPWYS